MPTARRAAASWAGPARPVVLTAAQRTADVAVRMWKNGVIAGTIVDEAGEPVVGVHVRAARRVFASGRYRFVPVGPAVPTDDRGMYRISDLLPGEYLIAVDTAIRVGERVAFRRRRADGIGERASVTPGGSGKGIQVGDAHGDRSTAAARSRRPRLAAACGSTRRCSIPPHCARAQATTIMSNVRRGAQSASIFGCSRCRPPGSAGTLIWPSGPAGMVWLRLVPAGAEEIASECAGRSEQLYRRVRFIYLCGGSSGAVLALGWSSRTRRHRTALAPTCTGSTCRSR